MKPASVTSGYVTATKIGELFEPKLKPAEVNQKLEAAGLHIKDEDGKTWRLTEKGEPLGVFIKIGLTGMVKWDGPAVAAMLGAKPAAAPIKKKLSLGVFGKKRKTTRIG